MANFKQLDLIENDFKEEFDYIYSISVLHMFVLDEHRDKYFEFIFKHLKKDGKALITVLGNGEEENMSDIHEAFDITERTVQGLNRKVNIVKTSCRVVNWEVLESEIEKSNLKIEKEWLSNDIPGFYNSMCIILRK